MYIQSNPLRQPRNANVATGNTIKHRNLVRAGLAMAKAGLCRWRRLLQRASYRRRLRRAIVQTHARFRMLYPEWDAYFFDTHFLLNQGLPIVDRYLAFAAPSSAIDLALAWLEVSPTLSIGQRKARLLALTPIAAKWLRMLTMELMRADLTTAWSVEENCGAQSHAIGVPLAYVHAYG